MASSCRSKGKFKGNPGPASWTRAAPNSTQTKSTRSQINFQDRCFRLIRMCQIPSSAPSKRKQVSSSKGDRIMCRGFPSTAVNPTHIKQTPPWTSWRITSIRAMAGPSWIRKDLWCNNSRRCRVMVLTLRVETWSIRSTPRRWANRSLTIRNIVSWKSSRGSRWWTS